MRWLGKVLLYVVAVALWPMTSSVAAESITPTLKATVELLSRELPASIEKRQIDQLSPYFADAVELKSNISIEPLRGKKWVMLALIGTRNFKTVVNSVVISANKIIFVENIPQEYGVERLALVPVIDIFHVDETGKIYLIERMVGDRVVNWRERN